VEEAAAMTLDALLRAHGFMKVERPPEIWEADTEDTRLVPLLGEMIAAALAGGGDLPSLTLNASNVSVDRADDPDAAEGSGPPAGEFVALTISGTTDLGPDGAWNPGRRPGVALLDRLADRLAVAGARYAYVRRTPPTGSITVFLARAR
jgi:hypothetical protein